MEYAKSARSNCKKCKKQIEKGCCRIGKITANPFSDDGGDMKVWFHSTCMFESLTRARATTKKIESPADLEGFSGINDEDKEEIKKLIKGFVSDKPPGAAKPPAGAGTPKKKAVTATSSRDHVSSPEGHASKDAESLDNSFMQFRRLCSDIERESSHNKKTKLVETYINHGNGGDGFHGEVYLLVKLLLPGISKRVYNLQSKQIVKLLSQVFRCSVDDMIEDLDHGDVAETAKKFFQLSTTCPPCKTSSLTLQEVDDMLEELSKVTKEESQLLQLTKICRKCTANDLCYIIRLIKHDIRIFAGAKTILSALGPNTYEAFQASNDLKNVVQRAMQREKLDRQLSIKASLMTPVKPMLAEACRSIEQAMKKCPNGFYAEIKYDGERVQVHKNGDTFEFFSRSLKNVQPHKIEYVKEYIVKACPHGNSIILDSEVLMVDNKTGNPLPFGTLGVHKRSAFKDATCCLFIFDILYFNGENLMNKPIKERRAILEKNVTEIPNHIMLSEMTLVNEAGQLNSLIHHVIQQGLEGLVLKDVKSIYEPGKRHWLKVKKDYLEGGAMADTADLVVLGAYYGTGNKGGIMSVFLMGVYDKSCDQWKTVAKCGNGHDDATIDRLQKELDTIKISKDYSKVPSWLLINKSLVPDFVVADPKAAPVWEITGAEFSHSSTHTAAGISIRFPRVTRIRDDKDWTTATDLARLKALYDKSSQPTDISRPSQKRPGSSAPSPFKKKLKTVNEPIVNNPLTDLFIGKKIFITTELTEYHQIRRYIIAYGGEVVYEFDRDEADHVISSQPSATGKVCVTITMCVCVCVCY